jgi:two-component system invasion response regulator UvrY
VVADDHALLRNAVVQLLERHGMEVVGQAATGDAAVLLAGKLSPDVVVMDVSMPGGISGIEATSRLSDILPRCRVIGFSVDHDPRARAQMIAAGAVAYVPKGDPPDALLAAIRKCMHTPLPPSPKRAQVESTRRR